MPAHRRCAAALSPCARKGQAHVEAHVLEWYSRRQRRVTRSTFAAELQGAADGYEQTRVICFALSAIMLPGVSVRELMALEERGVLPLHIELCTDRRSLFDALAGEEVKTPSEGSLIMVLHTLKEQLGTWHLKRIWWLTAEEMVADGLNKEAVSRRALLELTVGAVWILDAERRASTESTRKPLRGPLATLALADESAWWSYDL
jgi:hypothetical protein